MPNFYIKKRYLIIFARVFSFLLLAVNFPGWAISYQNLIESGSVANAKTKGLLRSEGKEYVVNEGDVMEFLFNV